MGFTKLCVGVLFSFCIGGACADEVQCADGACHEEDDTSLLQVSLAKSTDGSRIGLQPDTPKLVPPTLVAPPHTPASMLDDSTSDAKVLASQSDGSARLPGRWSIKEHTKERPECLAASIAMNMYQPIAPAPSGLVKSKTYLASTVKGDTDKAELWTKDGACWLSFIGSNHREGDFLNNMNYWPKEEWGIQGLHSGVVAELKPLLEQMDFSEIRGICSDGKLTVTGHSLGGGLAQMFSLAISKMDDPLNAKLTVTSLYTFGAMAISANDTSNDKAADGCFPGAQFWYAEHHGSTYITDVVALPFFGGQHTHIPTKSTKVFVFNETAIAPPEIYACGQPLPKSQSLYLAVGHAAWAPLHMNYYEWLRC
jgi:hypothetical protein